MECRILPISVESDRTPATAIRSTKIICCDMSVLPRHLCRNFWCDMWLIETLIDTQSIPLSIPTSSFRDPLPILMEKGSIGQIKGKKGQ